MTDKRLKELYNAEMTESAPDMNALWDKIDSNLTPKETPVKKKKSHITLIRTGALIAACVTLMVAVPRLMGGDKFASESANASDSYIENTVNTPDRYDDYADMEAAAEAETTYIATTVIAEENVSGTSGLLNYYDLDFAPSYENNLSCSGTPYGEDYFVEEEILVETECIIDAVVDKVYASPDGECIYYELTPKAVYGGNADSDTVTVASCNEYTMLEGREYIIPLKAANDGYSTVFDGVPQIEVTLDGGIVYYNGWECLNSVSSQSIIYPQNKVDDFFYDRMMFSYDGDISPLIEKWDSIRKTELEE